MNNFSSFPSISTFVQNTLLNEHNIHIMYIIQSGFENISKYPACLSVYIHQFVFPLVFVGLFSAYLMKKHWSIIVENVNGVNNWGKKLKKLEMIPRNHTHQKVRNNLLYIDKILSLIEVLSTFQDQMLKHLLNFICLEVVDSAFLRIRIV